jgi:hypothetical protein
MGYRELEAKVKSDCEKKEECRAKAKAFICGARGTKHEGAVNITKSTFHALIYKGMTPEEAVSTMINFASTYEPEENRRESMCVIALYVALAEHDLDCGKVGEYLAVLAE